jgi:hypothetical protein
VAGRPRTRLAERLVAEAVELLRETGRPVYPDVLYAVLSRDATTQVELDAAAMAMRRLRDHPLIAIGADGLIAHRVLTNGTGVHA